MVVEVLAEVYQKDIFLDSKGERACEQILS